MRREVAVSVDGLVVHRPTTKTFMYDGLERSAGMMTACGYAVVSGKTHLLGPRMLFSERLETCEECWGEETG